MPRRTLLLLLAGVIIAAGLTVAVMSAMTTASEAATIGIVFMALAVLVRLRPWGKNRRND